MMVSTDPLVNAELNRLREENARLKNERDESVNDRRVQTETAVALHEENARLRAELAGTKAMYDESCALLGGRLITKAARPSKIAGVVDYCMNLAGAYHRGEIEIDEARGFIGGAIADIATVAQAPEARGESGEDLRLAQVFEEAVNALHFADGSKYKGVLYTIIAIIKPGWEPERLPFIETTDEARALLAHKPAEESGPEEGDDGDDIVAVSLDPERPANKWSIMRRREIQRYKGQHIVVLMRRAEVEARVKESTK